MIMKKIMFLVAACAAMVACNNKDMNYDLKLK